MDWVSSESGIDKIETGLGDDVGFTSGEDDETFDADTCDAGTGGFDTQVNCENLIGTFP